MSAYTIIDGSRKANSITAVAEYAVPTGNNTAGTAWRDAVAETRAADGNTGVTLNPTKADDTAHIGKLDAGEIIEVKVTVEVDANSTNAEKVAVLEAAITAEVDAFTDGFQNRADFYGYTGSA